MSQNVAMKTNGIMVKGDYHQVLNNLALDKYNDEGGDRQGNGCVLCVLRYVRTNPVPINNNTIVLFDTLLKNGVILLRILNHCGCIKFSVKILGEFLQRSACLYLLLAICFKFRTS
jgi:hypothetical protein